MATKEKLCKEETIRLRRKHVGQACSLFFKQDPMKIMRGCGQYMYDEQGNKYLDCINNVAHVGHCHPDVVKAGAEQMAALSTNARFLHDGLVTYAQRVTDLLPPPLSVCFFVNSGSEANDLAIRLARCHTGRKDMITLDHAYHGHLTSLIEISPYKLLAGQGAPDHVHVAACPDVYRGKYTDRDHTPGQLGQLYAEDVKHLINKIHSQGRGLCAYIAESLQSCGGQIVYPPSYLRHVYRYVRDAGGLCIADEVQVGFGRVGSHWWAFQTQGDDIVPDIVTIGKSMGNGHPVALVVTTPEVATSFANSGIEYFNTYGGNPVSCAIANAVLDVIEKESLRVKVKNVSRYLINQLHQLQNKYPIIGDIRGEGMFLGIDLVRDRVSREPAGEEAEFIINKLKDEFILLSRDGPHRNVLKIKPPLQFNESDVDLLITKLEEVLSSGLVGMTNTMNGDGEVYINGSSRQEVQKVSTSSSSDEEH